MEIKRAYPVRGLNYKVYEEAHNQFAKGEKILLKPDIGNSFDKYAVGVHYSYLNNARIGFLPKEENEFYSLFLSQGGEYQAEIYFINETSQNHSLDYLFIKVILLLRTQAELDLFIKYNDIKQTNDLSIDRWIVKKLRFNKNKYAHSQRGYLIGGVTHINGRGFIGNFADFLPADNFTISGPLITIRVEVEVLNNNKYKVVAEYNENEEKYIKVNDDFEYEITDIRELRKNLDMQAFDIIGDIHGQAKELEKLLKKLGYEEINNIYQHPDRKVIFLGDFIDRGDMQRQVIEIVRPMIDHGHALAVMGNHEYNAICFATEDPNGGFLRKHSDKNFNQHKAFLDAYASDADEYVELLSWFKTLPLWIDLGNLRIIHACWDPDLIQKVVDKYKQPYLTDEFLFLSAYKDNWEYQAIETLLKGKEISLPRGHSFFDKENNERTEIRIKWWMQKATTYRDMFLGPKDAIPTIPDESVLDDCLINYDKTQPPVFLGHYWMNGDPVILAPNIACVDWSVAKPHGKLVAYSWMGENVLNNEHFQFVEREN